MWELHMGEGGAGDAGASKGRKLVSVHPLGFMKFWTYLRTRNIEIQL